MTIAVISGPGIYATFDWITKIAVTNGETIKEVSVARRSIQTDKKVYVIVQSKGDINGHTFNGHIIAPNYEDLVALVKDRTNLG